MDNWSEHLSTISEELEYHENVKSLPPGEITNKIIETFGLEPETLDPTLITHSQLEEKLIQVSNEINNTWENRCMNLENRIASLQRQLVYRKYIDWIPSIFMTTSTLVSALGSIPINVLQAVGATLGGIAAIISFALNVDKLYCSNYSTTVLPGDDTR